MATKKFTQLPELAETPAADDIVAVVDTSAGLSKRMTLQRVYDFVLTLLTATAIGAIPTSQKGTANGVAELDDDGLVPLAQLPSAEDQGAIPLALLGANNGVATLDGNGRIPASQLTVGAFRYRGVWDADANSPALTDGVGTPGDVYRVSVAGFQDLGSGTIDFEVGDYAILNSDSVWEKSDTTDAVSTVNGQIGVVELDYEDVGAAPAVHTHTTSQITDFLEGVQDAVGSMIVDSDTIDATYNDGAGTVSLGIKASSVELSMLAVLGSRGVLGRSSTGGNPELIAASTVGAVSYDGSTVAFRQITQAMIADDAVDFAQMAHVAALSVIGNNSNATAAPHAITAGTDGYVLRRSGTSLGFGQLALGAFADNIITPAKLNIISGLQTALAQSTLALFRSNAGIAGLDDANVFTAQQVISAGLTPLILRRSDDGTNGPQLVTQHLSASPAASDSLFALAVQGNDSGGNLTSYLRLFATLIDPTDGSEDARWAFETMVAGSASVRLRIDAGLYHPTVTGGDKGDNTINFGQIYEANVRVATLGANTITGAQTITADTTYPMSLIRSNDSNVGPFFQVFHNSASPAASDQLGGLAVWGRDSGGNAVQYGVLSGYIIDPTDGSEDSAWGMDTYVAGSSGRRLNVGGGVYHPSATGGDKGNNTLNFGQLYENNARVAVLTGNAFTGLHTFTNSGSTALNMAENTYLRWGSGANRKFLVGATADVLSGFVHTSADAFESTAWRIDLATRSWMVGPFLALGGITSASPAIKASGAAVHARLADDSGFAAFLSGAITISTTSQNVIDATNTAGASIINSRGGSGYGAFAAWGSGTNPAYVFFMNASNAERVRMMADNTRVLSISCDSATTTHLQIAPTHVAAGVPLRPRIYTIATLPTAGAGGEIITVSDLGGMGSSNATGHGQLVSDAASGKWRRWGDQGITQMGDADLSWSALVYGNVIEMVGTLTANRVITLANTGQAHFGMRVRVVRTGGGAFSLTVDNHNGTDLLVFPSGSTGSAEFVYDGTNWVLDATTANIEGTYTPTITGVGNVASSVADVCFYERRGSRVHVSGTVQIDPTTGTGALTEWGVSLPIASNLAAYTDLLGSGATASATGSVSPGVRVYGETTNDRAEMVMCSANTSAQFISFQFSYRVL